MSQELTAGAARRVSRTAIGVAVVTVISVENRGAARKDLVWKSVFFQMTLRNETSRRVVGGPVCRHNGRPADTYIDGDAVSPETRWTPGQVGRWTNGWSSLI